MNKKKVTMQEIADRLGVSKVTVSKALNGKEGVGAELREKYVGKHGRAGISFRFHIRAKTSMLKK